MGFKFDNARKRVKIEIEDKTYYATPGAEYEKIAKEYKKKAVEIAEKVETGEITEDQAENIMFDNTEKEIDEILGKGSAEKIFAGRERNAYDWASVLTYINSCVYPTNTGKYTSRKRNEYNIR